MDNFKNVSIATQKFIINKAIDIVTWYGVKKDPNDPTAPGNKYRHGAWLVYGDLRIIYESFPDDPESMSGGYLSMQILYHDELVFHFSEKQLRIFKNNDEWLIPFNELHSKIVKK